MIALFYTSCEFYVPSYHPLLINELKNNISKTFQVYDVAQLEVPEISRLLSNTGLVVLDHSILTAANISEPITNNLIIRNNKKDNSFFKGIWELILFSDKRIVYLASFLDFYAIKSSRKHDGLGIYYSEVLKRAEAIAWGFAQGVIGEGDVPVQYQEFSMKEQQESSLKIWNEIKSNIQCSIDLPHCISSNSIVVKDKKSKWDVAVPGMLYSTRKIAYESAQRYGLRIAPYLELRKYVLVTDRTLQNVSSTGTSIKLAQFFWRNLQKYITKNSYATFVCGSGYGYFVRKFLEIPAIKSMLITYPCVGLANYGFVDGYNSVYCNPEDIGVLVKEYLKKEKIRKDLINNAQKNLLSIHTVNKRAEQLLLALRELDSNQYKEAKFIKGKFEIIR